MSNPVTDSRPLEQLAAPGSPLSAQIADELQRLILNGDFSGQGRLPSERELGRRYGISRTAIREAVKLLSERGLVYSHPGRGTFVTKPGAGRVLGPLSMALQRSGASLSDVLAVRRAIEMETVTLAAANRGQEDIEALYVSIEKMDCALSNVEEYIEADQSFHRALAVASRNPVFVLLFDSLEGILADSRRLMYHSRGAPRRGQSHHREIAHAIEARDSVEARRWMMIHLEEVARSSADIAV